MNKNQKIALWVGIAVFVAVGLYPPWVKVVESGPHKGKYDLGYGLIFDPPPYIKSVSTEQSDKFDFSSVEDYMREKEKDITPVQIDLTRLLIQWVVVAVITLGLILTLGTNKNNLR